MWQWPPPPTPLRTPPNSPFQQQRWWKIKQGLGGEVRAVVAAFILSGGGFFFPLSPPPTCKGGGRYRDGAVEDGGEGGGWKRARERERVLRLLLCANSEEKWCACNSFLSPAAADGVFFMSAVPLKTQTKRPGRGFHRAGQWNHWVVECGATAISW